MYMYCFYDFCMGEKQNTFVASLFLFGFLSWRKSRGEEFFILFVIFVWNTNRHICRFALSLWCFFLEGNPNKKGKKGKKREKCHFHIYSRKQRCSLNFLSIFSLFPFFLQKKTFLKFLVFEWHEMCTKYPDRKNK